MVDAPTPKPPMNLNAANTNGLFANADPIAENKNKIPIHNKVFFLPILLVGIPPNIAPSTVPHNAIPITTVP